MRSPLRLQNICSAPELFPSGALWACFRVYRIIGSLVFGHVSILESSPQNLGVGVDGGFYFVIFDAKGCVILDDSMRDVVGHWKAEKKLF